MPVNAQGDCCTSDDDEQMAGNYARNGNWPTVSKDSLVACRPASTFQMTKMTKRKKKRRCKGFVRSATKIALFVLCVVLSVALLGVILAWAISSDGFKSIFNTSTDSSASCDTATVASNAEKSASTVSSSNDRWPSGTCTSAECARISTLFLDHMNRHAEPCEDFYEFACGGISETHDVPDDKPFLNRVGEVDTKLSKRLRKSLEEDRETNDTIDFMKEPQQLARILYQSCVDEESMSYAGLEPLERTLESLGGWPVLRNSTSDHQLHWSTVAGRMMRDYGGYYLLEMTVGQHPKNTSTNVIKFDQPELALSSRTYYLNGTDNALVKTYFGLMVNVAVRLGASRAEAEAEMLEALEFEIDLAQAVAADDTRRDANRMYNPRTVGELKRKAPKVHLGELLNITFPMSDGFKMNDNTTIIVLEDRYYEQLEKILEKTEQRVILNYLLWRLIRDHLILMPSTIRSMAHRLRELQFGVASIPQRADECVQLTRAVLPMIIGKLYVEKYFDPNQRHEVESICENLKTAFIGEIKILEWMDNETRSHAMDKAHALKYKVAYPQRLFNHSWLMEAFGGVQLSSDTLFENVVTLKKCTQHDNLKKLKEPVDPDHWFESPTLVDAYYAPARNEMVFPAGILQFPFFNRGAPAYVNYAMIGTVISHEITHGFDDEGRRYDVRGNLEDWWDKKTAQEYESKSKKLEAQYSSIVVPEVNKKLNGKMTLGENIADNGGVKTAYEAYKRFLEMHGSTVDQALPGLQNFTNFQLFFIAYANNWCTLMRPEAYDYFIASDVHAPPRYRTMVPLRNLPQFAKAFNCPVGSGMNPKEKCIIW